MVIVKLCVGSSCHLKGAKELSMLLQKNIDDNNLGNDIILTGSLCLEKCNRDGVTIAVDDDIYTGITPEKFNEFWKEKILSKL